MKYKVTLEVEVEAIDMTTASTRIVSYMSGNTSYGVTYGIEARPRVVKIVEVSPPADTHAG